MATQLLNPQYQEEFYLGVIEELARNVDVFNQGSNGTLLIGSEDYMGDYIKEAMYDRVGSLITRRDISVDTAATDLRMALNEYVGVDVAHKVGPVFEPDEAFKRRGRSVNEMAGILGQQFAGDFIARGLDLLVGSIVAAVDGVGTMKNTTQNAAKTNYKHLVAAQRLFGDQYRNVGAYMMNSEAFFDLVEDGLDNYKMDTVAGVTIVSGGQGAALGKPIIVSDVSALRYDDGAGDLKNRILALTQGAGSVVERSGRELVIDRVTGLENLGYRYQGETNTMISVKGFAWNTAAGNNPTDAALQTSANWLKVADDKLLAASLVESEAV